MANSVSFNKRNGLILIAISVVGAVAIVLVVGLSGRPNVISTRGQGETAACNYLAYTDLNDFLLTLKFIIVKFNVTLGLQIDLFIESSCMPYAVALQFRWVEI